MNVFKVLTSVITITVGYKAGKWLWDEVLEEKASNVKDRLSKKKN